MVALFSLARIWGECSTIILHLRWFLLWLLFFVIVFEVEISSRTQIPFFMPGSVSNGSRAEKNVAERFLTSCV